MQTLICKRYYFLIFNSVRTVKNESYGMFGIRVSDLQAVPYCIVDIRLVRSFRYDDPFLSRDIY